jgi:hypothetical protein
VPHESALRCWGTPDLTGGAAIKKLLAQKKDLISGIVSLPSVTHCGKFNRDALLGQIASLPNIVSQASCRPGWAAVSMRAVQAGRCARCPYKGLVFQATITH